MAFTPLEIRPGHPLHAVITAMLAQAEKQAPEEVPPHLRPGHEYRFLFLRDGKPFACCRRDPRDLIGAFDWPEGSYDIQGFCSCYSLEDRDYKPVGSAQCFGDGIGTLRIRDGGIWSSDMPYPRPQSPHST